MRLWWWGRWSAMLVGVRCLGKLPVMAGERMRNGMRGWRLVNGSLGLNFPGATCVLAVGPPAHGSSEEAIWVVAPKNHSNSFLLCHRLLASHFFFTAASKPHHHKNAPTAADDTDRRQLAATHSHTSKLRGSNTPHMCPSSLSHLSIRPLSLPVLHTRALQEATPHKQRRATTKLHSHSTGEQ
ncbi:putative acetoacetyl-CoA synthetase [Sesbania bispinosa]|nr:putative acetoacetyl-CoA synthetase [Sesbania bispinosa]